MEVRGRQRFPHATKCCRPSQRKGGRTRFDHVYGCDVNLLGGEKDLQQYGAGSSAAVTCCILRAVVRNFEGRTINEFSFNTQAPAL